jgi:hypothetical protein
MTFPLVIQSVLDCVQAPLALCLSTRGHVAADFFNLIGFNRPAQRDLALFELYSLD